MALAALASVCLAGLLSTQLRLLVAGLPLGRGLFTVPIAHSLLRGVVLVAVATGLLAAFSRCGLRGGITALGGPRP